MKIKVKGLYKDRVTTIREYVSNYEYSLDLIGRLVDTLEKTGAISLRDVEYIVEGYVGDGPKISVCEEQ